MRASLLQKSTSASLILLALALLVCAWQWPAWAEQQLHSRLGTALLGAWCWGFAGLLHPELRELGAGVALGFRQFRQECRDLRDYFGRWF